MIDKYASYTVEEFAADTFFKEWILQNNPKQDLFWQNFLFQYPEKANDIAEAKALILAMEAAFLNKNTPSAQLKSYFKEIETKAAQQKDQIRKIPQKRNNRFQQWAIAATITLVLGGGVLWWLLGTSFQKNNIRTAYGEWKKLTLPDSSIVQLNANSEILIPEEWEKGTDRKVWLETGEAFFEVTKKPASKAKFYVIIEDLTIEVLGTAFNVNTQEDKTEVYLKEGQIRLNVNGEQRFMKPGDFITYSKDTKKIRTSHQSEVAEELGSWKDGTLVLMNSTGKEILDRMEEIYGISFKVENESLLEMQTKIGIPMDELETAISILEITLETEITKNADNQWIVK